MATSAPAPDDRPAYARPALLVVAAIAVLLYAWDINHSQYHAFYADAARSMSENWKAFFFGSFDPNNSITLDKLPGFLWPQALSARVFGFHPWALALPQVLEGVAGVLVLHRVVRRWAGENAALIAAVAFLVTPVAAGLFRSSVEDPAFTLCVLLAAEATQRAAASGRLRPLLLAGFWVGLGFQSKMLEAWAVLPALAAVHLVSAPVARRRRIAQVALAGLVTVAVSLSWMTAVTLTPAKARPYIDGTTDNNAFSMVVGYNFLNRFSALGISAAATGSVTATRGGGHPGGADPGGAAGPMRATGHGGDANSGGAYGGAYGEGGQDGWSKMFESSLASQTGWFYPWAALSIACGLLWRRRRPRTDRIRAGYLLWGVWLATYVLVFSAGSVGGHTYYMGVVATPLAALVGGGTTLMWRAYRAGGRRAWALPGAVAATVAWGAWISLRFAAFLPWLAPTEIVLGLLALALLVRGLLPGALPGRTPGSKPGSKYGSTPRRRIALAGLLAGLVAVLIAPGAWTAQVFNPAYGSTAMGSVGPSSGGSGRQGHGVWFAAGPASGRVGSGPGTGAGGFAAAGSGTLSAPQQRLLDYTLAHRGAAAYDFATSSWSVASPFSLAAGAEVLPLGGFTGEAPFPTLRQFQRLVGTGRLRYVLLGGPHGFGGGFGGGFGSGTGGGPGGAAGAAGAATTTGRITAWVKASCTAVPAGAYGGGTAAQTLYTCPSAR